MHNVLLSCIIRLRRAPVAASIGAYALFVLVLIAGIAHGARMIVSRGTAPVEALLQLGESASSASRKPQPVETASAVLEGDSWLQSVKSNFPAGSNWGRIVELGGYPRRSVSPERH
jgi:hypothetical protein